MKPQSNSTAGKPAWQYFKAAAETGGFLMQLTAIPDFIRLAEMHGAKAIFLLGDDPAGGPAHFAIAYNGGLLRQATGGFNTLEDYTAAIAAGFTVAVDYYTATAAGYTLYNDYRLALDAGVAEADTISNMKQAGFIDGFAEWQAFWAEATDKPLPEPRAAANAYELYQLAQAQHFDTWGNMLAAMQAGFTDGHEYEAAKKSGFTSAVVYEEALSRGLTSMKDYEFALEHRLRDARDIHGYVALELAPGGLDTPHDGKVLLILLSRLEQGRRASANKLWEHLCKLIDEHRYDDTGEMPLWFKRSLKSREDLVAFLTGNDEVKAYGTYDGDGEFFESKRLREREVVIDGSNIAYNSVGRKEAKPRAAHLLRMVRFLKEKGFERISIISDASLRHRLEDKEVLEEVRAEAEYIEAPAEKPADVFLIQHVRNHHCLLVSNDTFREWKVQEPWVAENIDYYRLTFLIRGEEVLMPDLV